MFESISKILNPFRSLEKIGDAIYQTAKIAVTTVMSQLGVGGAGISPAEAKHKLHCLVQPSAVNRRRSFITRNCEEFAKMSGRPPGRCETKLPLNLTIGNSTICEAAPEPEATQGR